MLTWIHSHSTGWDSEARREGARTLRRAAWRRGQVEGEGMEPGGEQRPAHWGGWLDMRAPGTWRVSGGGGAEGDCCERRRRRLRGTAML
jgi:hypothetical protein